jgi:thiol-disulfide isomerase/thioredoxin
MLALQLRDPTQCKTPFIALPGDWINAEPIKLKDLRGRVVLIDFWTFGCFNCRNTLPFIKGWHDRYRDKGLTVIGVHSPEFDHERKIENLRREVASLEIHYPVCRITTTTHGTLTMSELGRRSFVRQARTNSMDARW